MKKKKTLKEKIAAAGRSGNFTCSLYNSLSDPGICNYDCMCECRDDVADALIDAIDREYIERPRFEDGEPVQIGDNVYWNREARTVKDVIPALFFDDNSSLKTRCTMKRPEPEFVGADGKPIKVGDTVYDANPVEYSLPYTVTEVTAQRIIAVGASGGPRLSACKEYAEEYLTHERHDSLERIEEDAKRPPYGYVCDVMGDYSDMDKDTAWGLMVEDLLTRQRKVLGREQR